MKRVLTYFIFVSLIFISCTKDIGKQKVDKVECLIPSTVSFNQNIVPFFNQYCNTAGCHSGGSPAGNLDLSPLMAYSKLNKSGSGYLDTINPNFSLLYSQMISVSNPMPPTGKLDDCKLEMVLKWIQQKAKNN